MKLLLITFLLAVTAFAEEIENPAFGYLEKYGVPHAERIRVAEEAYHSSPESRIVGGVPAALGQYPYQVCKKLFLNQLKSVDWPSLQTAFYCRFLTTAS